MTDELRDWDYMTHVGDTTGKPPKPPIDHKHDFLVHVSGACSACKMCDLGFKQAEKTTGETTIARDPHCFSNMRTASRFMIIGQNPGWNELAAGEPFVGQAGKNFDVQLRHWGLSRADFYVTNCVKCWTSGNAKPTAKQQARCAPFLQLEISTIKPLLTATLGASAFETVCPGHNYGEAIATGKLVHSDRFGISVYPIYHPSPLNMTTNRAAFEVQMRKFCKLVLALRERQQSVAV